ncbi:MAG: PAS domain S-box protein [Methanomicrobiales archaeon]|nr:PAS domain S-box protein [Methanomicrobiales archaeon]
MKQYDDLEKALLPLLVTLEDRQCRDLEARIHRAAAGVRRLEADNMHLLRERASIHALLKKTSEDLIHRYQTIFENSGTGMLIIEADGTISLVNSIFEQISGYSREEVEHRTSVFSFIIPADRDRISSYHAARRQGGSGIPAQYETRFIRKDGRVIDADVYVQLFPGTLQSIASVIDMTERRRAEISLKNAHAKLTMLSNLSRHDILNQLTVLSGYLELSRNLVSEPRFLEFIRKETDVTNTITEMISFTKDYQEIGINSPVWQGLEDSIAHAVNNIRPGEVVITIDAEPVEIFADLLLERVFYNLMENALKYGGTLSKIRFSFERSGSNGIIVCEDDGAGIPAGEKENIFQRKFFRHTGLGLFLSREILAITGITITETGTLGAGARFEMVVPEGGWRERSRPGAASSRE